MGRRVRVVATQARLRSTWASDGGRLEYRQRLQRRRVEAGGGRWHGAPRVGGVRASWRDPFDVSDDLPEPLGRGAAAHDSAASFDDVRAQASGSTALRPRSERRHERKPQYKPTVAGRSTRRASGQWLPARRPEPGTLPTGPSPSTGTPGRQDGADARLEAAPRLPVSPGRRPASSSPGRLLAPGPSPDPDKETPSGDGHDGPS